MTTGYQFRRFGPFELDVAGGELSREGAVVRLELQPLKVLALLTERPGRVVSRSEIRETIWGPDTYVDFDQGLNYCVRKIRIALGDDSANPVYLETLPKKGYRFVHLVEEGSIGPDGAWTYTGSRARGPHTGGMQKGVAGLAIILLLTFGVFLVGEAVSSAASETVNYPPEARRAFMRGRFLAQDATPLAQRRSLQHYRRAIETAPTWPEPYAAMSSARLALGDIDLARKAAEKALRLDSDQQEALRTLAVIALRRFDIRSAEELFRRAQTADPLDADTLRLYANLLSATGRHTDATRSIGQAIELDPLSLLVRGDAGWHFFLARRYTEAAQQCHQALELAPNNRNQHWLLGQIYALTDQPRLALNETVAFVDILTGKPEMGDALRQEFTRAGLSATWSELLNRAERLPPAAIQQVSYRAAALAAQLGDLPGAMRWLKRAQEAGSGTLLFLAVDPRFDSVRDAPEFREFAFRLRPPEV